MAKDSEAADAPSSPAGPASSPDRHRAATGLAAARSWGYQLQKPKLAELAASEFDALVIDYALDGSDDTALKPADVQRLQRKPDGSRRIVLAYISIGEAESYRFYWNERWEKAAGRPAWLLGENPEWEENYSVCFWDPGWQSIIFGSPQSYVDRIIAQGFDGVYLDKCDVYEDIREHFQAVAKTRPNLEQDMVAFATRLSAYAKSCRPDFLVVMQNAELLLEQPALRRALDGVAKEELVFGLDGSEKRNSADDLTEVTNCLDLLKREGKPVFVIEYLNNRAKMEEAAQVCGSRAYVLAVSPKNRELDRLGISI